mmetsp:Transcript_38835/g.59031  ORF Transcript_38835/g.59031 Transcript_38835/m.59031 type:complete len:189 (-) Transcript_38835:1631-2197(-)
MQIFKEYDKNKTKTRLLRSLMPRRRESHYTKQNWKEKLLDKKKQNNLIQSSYQIFSTLCRKESLERPYFKHTLEDILGLIESKELNATQNPVKSVALHMLEEERYGKDDDKNEIETDFRLIKTKITQIQSIMMEVMSAYHQLQKKSQHQHSYSKQLKDEKDALKAKVKLLEDRQADSDRERENLLGQI